MKAHPMTLCRVQPELAKVASVTSDRSVYNACACKCIRGKNRRREAAQAGSWREAVRQLGFQRYSLQTPASVRIHLSLAMNEED